MADRKRTDGLTVITKTYDLILWSCNHTEKFPRNHRFVLGERIERNQYDLLEILIRAKYSRQRQELLIAGQPRTGNPAIPDSTRQGLAVPQGRDLRLRSQGEQGHRQADAGR